MNKIIFSDGTEFSTVPYPIETEPSIFAKKIIKNGVNREFLRISIQSTYANVASKFIQNASYFVRQYDIDANGNELLTYTDFDWSGYNIAGDIVDHRNGIITVYMAKPTESEIAIQSLETENAALLFENLTGQTY